MKTRPFANTSIQVSEVGLGTWQLGGTEWGSVTDQQAFAVLQQAYEAGITLFDTADIYGQGRSETLIGQFLNNLGASARQVLIATKLGRRFDTPSGWPQNFSLQYMRQHTHDSLKRLGIEQIFLQQFHCIPFVVLQQGEVFDNMRTLQKEGLIRHWGVSVETVEEGLFCLKQPGCAALQVIFNIFRQKLIRELLPLAQAAGVAILARVPLASGLLSGRFTPNQAFATTDHRYFNANGEKFNVGETFAGVPFDKGLALVEKIRTLLQPSDKVNLATLALRWILDHPAVTSVIPGATKAEQVKRNAAASDIQPLGEPVHEQLHILYDREIRPLIRGKY